MLNFLRFILLSGFLICAFGATAKAEEAAGNSDWQFSYHLGPEAYYYHYVSDGAKFRGAMMGLQGDITAVRKNLFLQLDVHGGGGWLDHTVQGESDDGVGNLLIEPRAIIGGNFAYDGVSFRPYTGLAYRGLLDLQDGHQRTENGATFSGYDRVTEYLYVPVGLTAGFHTGSGWRVSPTLEYDYFVSGRQTYELGGTTVTAGGTTYTVAKDLSTPQDRGFGLRAGIAFDTQTDWGNIRFTPFARYWKIKASKPKFVDLLVGGVTSGTMSGFEPSNETLELGASLTWQF